MELSRRIGTLVRSLYTRHGRKKSGLCVAEGLRCCSEVFAAVPELVEFTLVADEAAGRLAVPGEVFEVSREQISALGATVNSQGILTVVKQPPPAAGRPSAAFLPVLDQVADPGNFGTIIRTALAAGLDEIWYTSGSADPYNDKVVRSALGAQFRLKLRRFENLADAASVGRECGYGKVFLTDPHEGESCFALEGLFDRTLVVIGGEANGVGSGAEGRRVTIPMPGGFESLNAAQAATVFIFEYVRRSLVK